MPQTDCYRRAGNQSQRARQLSRSRGHSHIQLNQRKGQGRGRARRLIGVDVGGTLTDLLTLESDSQGIVAHKIPSTPSPPLAVIRGLEVSRDLHRIDVSATEPSMHGRTIGENFVSGEFAADFALFHHSYRWARYRLVVRAMVIKAGLPLRNGAECFMPVCMTDRDRVPAIRH